MPTASLGSTFSDTQRPARSFRFDWQHLVTWLKQSKPLVPDVPAGQAYLDKHAEAVARRIQDAHESVSEFDRRDRQERSLQPDDGMVGPAPP